MSLSIEPTRYDTVVGAVVDVLDDLTSDWDRDLSGGITEDSQLVADLGFESLDVVMLLVSLEERFDRRELPFTELLFVDGALVEDVTVRELSRFLARQLDGQDAGR